MEKKEIIENLLKNGAEMTKNLKVKNITVKNCENYDRVSITLDKPVKGMISKDNGVTYEEGETNVIFVSLFSIAALLKDDDNVAFAVNHILAHPDSISVIMSRATINVIQQKVAQGEEYVNPWSSSSTSTVFQHDTVISHITDIQLSDFGIRKADRLADSLLGI